MADDDPAYAANLDRQRAFLYAQKVVKTDEAFLSVYNRTEEALLHNQIPFGSNELSLNLVLPEILDEARKTPGFTNWFRHMTFKNMWVQLRDPSKAKEKYPYPAPVFMPPTLQRRLQLEHQLQMESQMQDDNSMWQTLEHGSAPQRSQSPANSMVDMVESENQDAQPVVKRMAGRRRNPTPPPREKPGVGRLQRASPAEDEEPQPKRPQGRLRNSRLSEDDGTILSSSPRLGRRDKY